MLARAVDALERANHRVRPRKDACVREHRVRALRSDCRACAEACPSAALGLDPLSVDLARCDGCRSCVVACPSGALADAPLAQNEMIQAFKAVRPNASFVIACATARKPEAGVPCLSAVCLGGIGWEHALIPLLLGASQVELRHGDPRRCGAGARCAAAPAEIQDRLAELRAELGLGHIVQVELPDQASAPPRAELARRRVTRRGLFSAFGSQARATAAELGSALGDELATAGQGGGDLDPLWLRTLVARLLARSPELRRAGPVTRFARTPEIREDRCTRCGLCATACPSGALARPPPGRRTGVHLTLLPHRCIGCERCVSACPEQAVRSSSGVDLRAWSARAPAPVVMERAAGCRICGGDGVLPGLDVCAPCRRERLLAKA